MESPGSKKSHPIINPLVRLFSKYRSENAGKSFNQCPRCFLILTAVSIFLAEAFVMIVLHLLPPLSLPYMMLVDAVLLTVLVFPILYLFMFKPLITHIAERKLAEEAQRKAKESAEAYNKQLMEKTIYIDNILRSSENMAIIATDIDLNIKYFNPVAERFFAQRAEEVTGRTVNEILPGDKADPAFFERAISTVVNKGEYRHFSSININGETCELENTITGIWDKSRNYLVGFVLISQDITERKRTERELKEKSALLEELNKNLEGKVLDEMEKRRVKEQLLIQQSRLAAMGEMMGAIAHQWRQPINTLGILIQDLEDAYRAGEIDKKYIDDTVKRTLRLIQFMSGTIDDFRNFLKPSKEKVFFDVKLAIKEVLSLICAQLKHHNIFLRFSCNIDDCDNSHNRKHIVDGFLSTYTCEECPGGVFGYPNEFKQVMLNIIDNAEDAILVKRLNGLMGEKDKGKIAIEIYRENGNMMIRTRDNGGGIPEEIMGKLFEPYFTTKKDKGTGIGLYMSHVIIENSMGGKLYAENKDGGAVFTIELEIAECASNEKGKDAV